MQKMTKYNLHASNITFLQLTGMC